LKICKYCGKIVEPDDEGEYCAYCLTRLDFEDNFWEIAETIEVTK
jgi:hypothetical protein